MKPLEGIKVLDLSRVLAGPWCTQLLADLGAEVIKIERPGVGDDTRHWGPPWFGEGEQRVAAYFLSCNRGKKSAAIDFAQPDGAALVRKLAEKADVVVENFKVGGLEKFGLDAASLLESNPRLVYASITGFGQNGPYAKRAGYDFMIQAMGGLMSITGRPDGEPGGGPMRVGVAVADLFTGMYTAVAILAALFRRERSGEGASYRYGLVRHAARRARQPGVECAGFGGGSATAGEHASEPRPLPAVRGRRPANRHRGRERPPVRAACRNLWECQVGERRALRDERGARRQSDGNRRADQRCDPTEAGCGLVRATRSCRDSCRPNQFGDSGPRGNPVPAPRDAPDDCRRADGRLAGAARWGARRCRPASSCARRAYGRGARGPRASFRRSRAPASRKESSASYLLVLLALSTSKSSCFWQPFSRRTCAAPTRSAGGLETVTTSMLLFSPPSGHSTW